MGPGYSVKNEISPGLILDLLPLILAGPTPITVPIGTQKVISLQPP
jgi:hypothetical protein